jgi:hypothetical protein
MSINGNLETFPLGSLLQILSYENKTGRLKIRSETNEVQIIMHEGDIVFATEAQKSNRIGLLLMNHGLITQDVLEESLKLSRERSQGIGKTLVQEGHISIAKLNAFLMKQAENSIYNVFLWKSGEFSYTDTPINLKGVAGNKLDTMNILLEAARRIDEFAVLKKRIPDDQGILEAAAPSGNKREVNLNEDEWRLLSLIDGKSTVRNILDQTGYDDFTGYQIVNTLLSSGEIEIKPVMSKEELAEQAVQELRTVDARQFRETLDRMGLKRSSMLRMALSRIYRDTMESSQLLQSVETEAGKMGDSSEKKALQHLRQNSRTPFMKALLELLEQSVNAPE